MPVARLGQDQDSVTEAAAWIKESQELAKIVLSGRSGVKGVFLPAIFLVGTVVLSTPGLNWPFLCVLRAWYGNGRRSRRRRAVLARIGKRLSLSMFHLSCLGMVATVIVTSYDLTSRWGLLGVVFIGLIMLEVRANENAVRNGHTTNVSVPKWGAYLLYLFLSRQERDGLLGDLEEGYQEVHARFGTWAARVWYWKQVLTSLWPLLLRAASTLIKVGALGWIKHLTERFIH